MKLALQLHWYIHRWVHTASPLISNASFIISALEVSLTFQDVDGLVIDAKFFSQSANPLKNNCLIVVSITHQLKSTILDRFQLAIIIISCIRSLSRKNLLELSCIRAKRGLSRKNT